MDHAERAITAVFEAHVEALARELRGAGRADRIAAALDELMRVQAVSVPAAGAAIAFLDGLPVPAAVIEGLRPLALDLFDTHRARIAEIRAAELGRADFVARRVRGRRPPPGCDERGSA